MGLRFRKSFKIAPGVRINLSKNSTSLSFGGKGLRYSINSKGRRTASVGIPGSGLSYSTSSNSRRTKTNAYSNRQALLKQQRELDKYEALERAKYEVAQYENQVEMLTSIHKEADDIIDWEAVRQSAPPFSMHEKGPLEKEAIRQYESYKPSFFDRLFKSRQEEKNQQFLKEIESARQEDAKNYQTWENVVALSKQVLGGDIDSYFQVIQEMDPLGDLTEFGSGFEFSTDDPSYMEVDFDVHSEEMVPTTQKLLTKTGKLSEKALTKTRYYELQQDYVCSCVIRIARDLFALLPLEDVYIHAYEDIFYSETGHTERECILSVKINKEMLYSLNLDYIDCSDSMVNFTHNMNFRKTKGFSVVPKLIP